jgi:hypothetical protein
VDGGERALDADRVGDVQDSRHPVNVVVAAAGELIAQAAAGLGGRWLLRWWREAGELVDEVPGKLADDND